MRFSCQIAALCPAALVVAHPLKCPTAGIATVTVLEQQLIIVPINALVLEPSQVTTQPQYRTRSQTTFLSHITTDSDFPKESDVPSQSQSDTRGSTYLEDHLAIAMTNKYGIPLSISFGSNVDGPSPIDNSTATTLAHASPTQYTFPTGWAGRIYVGPNLNPQGSKIEGSYTGPPDVDVSYVDEYTVPITCASEGKTVAGCNIDLFSQAEMTCDQQLEEPVCLNSARENADGPPPPFFAACQGAAYTYPNDNEANVSNLRSRLITCCVGTSCDAPARQTVNRCRLAHQGLTNRKNGSEYHARELTSLIKDKHRSGSGSRYLPLLAPG